MEGTHRELILLHFPLLVKKKMKNIYYPLKINFGGVEEHAEISVQKQKKINLNSHFFLNCIKKKRTFVTPLINFNNKQNNNKIYLLFYFIKLGRLLI